MPIILQITDPSTVPYTVHWDFWVFIGLAIIGFGLSIISIYQAYKAKLAAIAATTAAQAAANIVKVQDVLLDTSRIINICQISFTDDYIKAINIIDQIDEKMNFIIGVMPTYVNIEANLLTDISKTIETIRTNLNQSNPVVTTIPVSEADKVSGQIYYAIAPDLGILRAKISRLAGWLNKHVISQNN